MIKNLVNRLSGKGEAEQKPTLPSGSGTASASPAQPPRDESSAKGSAAEHARREGAPRSANNGRKRRRSRKPKAAAAQWSLDEFVVEPKEGETRFHDLGLRDELMELAKAGNTPRLAKDDPRGLAVDEVLAAALKLHDQHHGLWLSQALWNQARDKTTAALRCFKKATFCWHKKPPAFFVIRI